MVTPSIGALLNVYPTQAALTRREFDEEQRPAEHDGLVRLPGVIPASTVTVHPETAGSIAEALTLTLPQAFDNEDNRRHG
jgi:hypothetical protein